MNIKNIILDQREEWALLNERTSFIQREYLTPWKDLPDEHVIKVITGPRRCGKSVFSRQLMGDRPHAFVNFDDERLAFLDTDGLNRVLEALYEVYGNFTHLILDEVQNIHGWELFVNRLQRRGISIIVTGSNAHLLGSELATHLTGRHIRLEMLPFSFREHLRRRSISPDPETTHGRALLKNALEEYISRGGFPEMYDAPDHQRMAYLKEQYRSMIERDIVMRHRIRYVRTFREITASLISSHTAPISYNRIGKGFGLKSTHTAKNYVDHLAEAYLVFLLDKYSHKSREVMNSRKKLYAVDSSIIHAVAETRSQNRGRFMEHIVFIELMRKKALDPDMNIYYWKDPRGREVDFIITRKGSIHRLIQVTYCSDRGDVPEREIRNLVAASPELGCPKLEMITWDLSGSEMHGSREVVFRPLFEWLLTP